MSDTHKIAKLSCSTALIADLGRAFNAVGALMAMVLPEQWSAPTPCTDWDVSRLMLHLSGMNLVFTALLLEEPMPPRPADGYVEADPVGVYRDPAAALLSVFAQPGVLARQFEGPMGSARGADRLQIRMYDLLVHGWDLAQATDRPAHLPDDLAEQSLTFARGQVTDLSRPGRFDPVTAVRDDAPAIERLAAFLGRPILS